MGRHKLLLTVLFALIATSWSLNLTSAAAAKDATNCTREQFLSGTCAEPGPVVVTPGIGNGGVDLGGSVSSPGATPGTGNPADPTVPGGAPPAEPVCDPIFNACRNDYNVTSPLDGRGPITLSDLVNFRPITGAHRMEPDGWTVVGLETNFFAETSAHVQDNLLLGIPASVRFTPVTFRWDYGDGSSATRSVKGSSWEASGVAEFDATATSHVYRAAGTYDVDLTIDFRAEYRFGPSAWISIAGTVPVASNRLSVTAGDAKTVLVERECSVAARGPGC